MFSQLANIRFKYLLFSLILTSFFTNSIAQTERCKSYLKQFNSLSYIGKINSFDTLSVDLKREFIPFVKTELEKIKLLAIKENKDNVLDKFNKIEAELHYINSNYTKAIPIFIDLLAKNKIKGYKDSVSVLYYLKSSFIKIHSFNKAIEIHKTLEQIRKNHDDIDAWKFHPKLSVIYYELKMYKECLSQQLLEFEEIQNNSHMVLGYYNNRGLFWGKAGNLDSSIWSFNKAKEIFYKTHTKTPYNNDELALIGLINGNIGQIYIAKKEYSKAIPLLKEDIHGSKLVFDYLNAAISYIETSICYLNLNQLELCKQSLDSASKIILATDDFNSRLRLYLQLAKYYEKTNNISQTTHYYNKYINYKDSVEKLENVKQLIASQVAFQMNEKEKLISQNIQKIKDKNYEVSKQKTIKNTLLIGGFILLSIVIYISVQLRKTKFQKQLLEIKNKRIETRNEIINKSLIEKDLLVKEVHHRVKNNLQIISSLLKLQASKTSNKEIIKSLSEAQDRINSMAVLHQLLYRNNEMTKIWLNEYLLSLLQQISAGFSDSNNSIFIKTDIIELELDLDTAIPLGLITNELISNSFKHAFNEEGGIINVELKKLVKNTYCLKVSDNGTGLTSDFDLNSVDSLGLDIVSILCEQINAELKIYNANGANFEIVFKV